MLDPAIAAAVSVALTRICSRSAFFGALALFARFESRESLPTAATDGRDIFLNSGFFGRLSAAEQEAVLLHEVLHAALLHVPRRGGRDPQLWNVAADIVVNGMLAREGYQLPAGGLRDPSREHLGTEELYELLLREPGPPRQAAWADLLDGAGEGQDGDGAAQERYWGQALQQARVIVEGAPFGSLPAGFERELGQLDAGRLDWRSLLWRHLARAAIDFQGFDRRFVGQGLYLDALDGETLRVAVAVDTSGSIGARELPLFVSEVRGVLRTYPHLRCDLYYADATLHGPYRLHRHGPIPPPVGGGGTDFRPFFAELERQSPRPGVAVYLTDGYGAFPERGPPCPVLWVVTPGGRDLQAFPFGQATRLLGAAGRAGMARATGEAAP